MLQLGVCDTDSSQTSWSIGEINAKLIFTYRNLYISEMRDLV